MQYMTLYLESREDFNECYIHSHDHGPSLGDSSRSATIPQSVILILALGAFAGIDMSAAET
jgi:hypothetical protein